MPAFKYCRKSFNSSDFKAIGETATDMIISSEC